MRPPPVARSSETETEAESLLLIRPPVSLPKSGLDARVFSREVMMKLGIQIKKANKAFSNISLSNTVKAAAVLAALAPSYSMADSPTLLAALESHDRVELHQSSDIDFNQSIKGALTGDYPEFKGSSVGFVKDLVMHKMNVECMPDPAILKQIEDEGKILVSCTTDPFKTSGDFFRVDVVTTDSDLSKTQVEHSRVMPSLKDHFFFQKEHLLKRFGVSVDKEKANIPTVYELTHVPAGFAAALYKDNNYSTAVDIGRAAMDLSGKTSLKKSNVQRFLRDEGYIGRFNARGDSLAENLGRLESLGVLKGLPASDLSEIKASIDEDSKREQAKGLYGRDKGFSEYFIEARNLALSRYQDGINDATLQAAGMKPCDLSVPSYLQGGQAELNTRCLAESGTSIGLITSAILTGAYEDTRKPTLHGNLLKAIAVGNYKDHPVVFHTSTGELGTNMYVLIPEREDLPRINPLLGDEKTLNLTKTGAINITHDYLRSLGAEKMTPAERKAIMEVSLNHEIKHLRDAHEYSHARSGAMLHDYNTVQQLDCDTFGVQEYLKLNPSREDASVLKSAFHKSVSAMSARGDYIGEDMVGRLNILIEYTQQYLDGKLAFDEEGILKKVGEPSHHDHAGHDHHSGHKHKPAKTRSPGF